MTLKSNLVSFEFLMLIDVLLEVLRRVSSFENISFHKTDIAPAGI